MTRYDAMLRALTTGDPNAARVFWRSRHWTADERARMRRLLTAAHTLAQEIHP